MWLQIVINGGIQMDVSPQMVMALVSLGKGPLFMVEQVLIIALKKKKKTTFPLPL